MVVTQDFSPLLSLVVSALATHTADPASLTESIQRSLNSETRRARQFTNVQGEAEQAVRLGVLDAVASFDPEKGIPPVPYVRLVVRRTVDKHTRKKRVDKATVSGVELSQINLGRSGVSASSQRELEEVENRMLIDAVRSILSEAQCKFLDALVEFDFNAAEAARSIGLTASAGHKMLARIRALVQASPLAD